ncbi:MAG TPA: response regulator [Desulfobacterales bacterium]|nr:response regulator [Desulfobacterales bacterium]
MSRESKEKNKIIYKVMIVDEQPLLAKWLREDLSGEIYHISHTDNIDNISEEIMTFSPEIIILDISFDGFERWEILNRIKLEFPHIPVLLVSPYDNVIYDKRAVKADGVIIKDIYMNKVKDKIKTLCRPITEP